MKKSVLKALNQKPIAYYPIYRQITGSTTAGILLSQIMFWFSNIDDDTFYKTDKELIEETMLTPDELKSAKRKLKNLSFLEIKAKGLPAKTYYTINWELFEAELIKFLEDDDDTENDDSPKQESGNSTNSEGEIPQTVKGKSHKLNMNNNSNNNIYTKNTSREHIQENNSNSFLDKKSKKLVADAEFVANYLAAKILNFKPNAKIKPQSWIKDIDLAIRRDGRTKEELIALIDFIYSPAGEFWIPNVMSGKKLREKFDVIEAQMIQSRSPKRKFSSKVGRNFDDIMNIDLDQENGGLL